MIKLLNSTTHSKIIYKNASPNEIKVMEEYMVANFTVRDTSNRFDLRATQCLYDVEKNIFPTPLMSIVNAIVKETGLEIQIEDVREPVKKNPNILRGKFSNSKFELRDDQLQALRACYHTPFGGIVQSPVGTGKSIMIAGICNLIKEKKLLIIPSVSLLWQQKECLNDCGIDDSRIAVFQGENVKDEGDEDIILLNDDSYLKMAHLFPDVRAIILDETHYCSNTIEKIIFSCQKATYKVGFSATPLDHKNPYLNLRVRSLFGELLYVEDQPGATEKGLLVEMDAHIYHLDHLQELPTKASWGDVFEYTEIDEEQARALRETNPRQVEYKDKKYWLKTLIEEGNESIAIVKNEARNRIIADIALKHNRVLILVTRIEQGEALKELIGERAMLVTGANSIQERKKAKNYLNEVENAIVIASKIFNTGINIVGIENVIIADGGTSIILAKQKVGRASRKTDLFEKLKASVHDFNDVFHPITKRQSSERIKVYKELELKITNHYF